MANALRTKAWCLWADWSLMNSLMVMMTQHCCWDTVLDWNEEKVGGKKVKWISSLGSVHICLISGQWRCGSLINAECIHEGITYSILFSLLLSYHPSFLFPTFVSSSSPQMELRLIYIFFSLISVYSSSYFSSYRASVIKVNSLISLVQCQTSWVTYNFALSSGLFPSRMITIMIWYSFWHC